LGIAAELQVFAALRQVGADLGDPLEIDRRSGQVAVSGVGIAPARQRQIHAMLDGLPNVSLRFSEPEAAPAAAVGMAPAPAPTAPAGPGLLQQRLGGRAQFESLKSQLLDHSDAAMARAYALRRLAQEFPPETEREMTAADRALLDQLAGQHLSALATEAGAIDSAVSPILGYAVPAAGQTAAERGAWQSAAETVLMAAHGMETNLAALLGAAPAEAAGDLSSRFANAMGVLRLGLERCRLLLSYDDVGQR
jgi:hypothetical protein